MPVFIYGQYLFQDYSKQRPCLNKEKRSSSLGERVHTIRAECCKQRVFITWGPKGVELRPCASVRVMWKEGQRRTLCVWRDRALPQTTVGHVFTRPSERRERGQEIRAKCGAHKESARDWWLRSALLSTINFIKPQRPWKALWKLKICCLTTVVAT